MLLESSMSTAKSLMLIGVVIVPFYLLTYILCVRVLADPLRPLEYKRVTYGTDFLRSPAVLFFPINAIDRQLRPSYFGNCNPDIISLEWLLGHGTLSCRLRMYIELLTVSSKADVLYLTDLVGNLLNLE